MHAAASLQFKEGVGFRELRRWQTKLAFQRIQKFNQDFNVPVIIGLQAEEETGAHSHALRRHPLLCLTPSYLLHVRRACVE